MDWVPQSPALRHPTHLMPHCAIHSANVVFYCYFDIRKRSVCRFSHLQSCGNITVKIMHSRAQARKREAEAVPIAQAREREQKQSPKRRTGRGGGSSPQGAGQGEGAEAVSKAQDRKMGQKQSLRHRIKRGPSAGNAQDTERPGKIMPQKRTGPGKERRRWTCGRSPPRSGAFRCPAIF